MNLSPAVKKEYKKLYVAYKLDTNFVDIVFQKQRLRISINMKFTEINDPNGICKGLLKKYRMQIMKKVLIIRLIWSKIENNIW